MEQSAEVAREGASIGCSKGVEMAGDVWRHLERQRSGWGDGMGE